MNSLLIAFILSIITYIWWRFFREKIGYRFPNRLMRQSSRIQFSILMIWCFRYIGILAVFLLIYIHYGDVSSKQEDSEELIFVLDISKSMESDDVHPTRLEKAKSVLRTMIREQNIPTGLVIFSGKAFVMSPPTQDKRGLDALIQSITTETIDQGMPDASGTNIGDALLIAKNLYSSTTIGKHLLLITDGRANIGIDPKIVIDSFSGSSVRISTLGIGSTTGSILSYIDTTGTRREMLDASGATIRGDIDTSYLKELAMISGGEAYFIDSSEVSHIDFPKLMSPEMPILLAVHEKLFHFIPFILSIISIILWCLSLTLLLRKKKR